MNKRDFLKRLAEAMEAARGEITLQTVGRSGHDRFYAGGMANEGYDGGYYQALLDVDAVLRHGYPTDPRGLWSKKRPGG